MSLTEDQNWMDSDGFRTEHPFIYFFPLIAHSAFAAGSFFDV
jgi:hypothetical protein